MPRQCPNPKCNEIVSDTAQFCPTCGTRINESSTDVEQIVSPSNGRKPKKPLRGTWAEILLFLIATFLTWWLSLALGIYLINPNIYISTEIGVFFVIFLSIYFLLLHFLSRISSRSWSGYFFIFASIVTASTFFGGIYQGFGYSLVAGALVSVIGLPIFLKGNWSNQQGRGGYRGQVSSLQGDRIPDTRSLYKQMYIEERSFILLRTDEKGNPLQPLPVIIRARTISGVLRNGDEVEVRGQLVRGTLYAREIKDLSTGGASLVIKGWLGRP
jgi:hypothetical protein